QCLHAFDNPGHAQLELFNWPQWARHAQKATPWPTVFTTRKLFDTMYQIADEFSLAAGKRYISAAICTCADHVENASGTPEEQAALLAEVLCRLSAIWVVFVLWPFYARGRIRPAEPVDWRDTEDSTPTARSADASRAREQHRQWTQQIMARDNYWCPISGSFEYLVYDLPAMPPRALAAFIAGAPIIQRTVLTRGMCGSALEHEIAAHVLRHFYGLDDALLEKLDCPQNGLAMDTSVKYAFQRFMFCLRPTETPHRYKFEDLKPEIHFNVLQNVRGHVTPPPCSATLRLAPDLLRLHAALGWVLRLSGAGAVFDTLYRPPPSRGSAAYLSPGGAAFWRSVVEYEGPAVCLEAELRDLITVLTR
ncbi:hypothetical protein LXA43DRAFT_1132444, partial [Ganoderma leucocontextum]